MASSQDAIDPQSRTTPLGVAGVDVRRVAFDAPWSWLAAGWRDMWTVPGVSLVYGAVFAVAALVMLFGLTQFGAQSLILALGGGFMLLGPLVAVGLYEASRRLEAGQKSVTRGEVMQATIAAQGQLAFMGIVLLMIFLVWIQLAFLLFMLFTGANAFPPPSEFVPMLLFTRSGLALLVVGTAIGGLLAAIVFAVSAISVPLLMVKQTDAVTAISASLKTVEANPKPMALWAALIAGFMALGLLTLGVGLVLAFPLVGHATWHAFRALIDTGAGK
jgi:uncharacterized membrane protein